MNKLFTKIATLSVGLAMAIGVGVAIGSGSKSAASVNATDTKVAFTTGSNTVAIKVNWNSAGAPSSNNGVRMGTSNNAGSATFSIPSGTTKFGFYAVGWSGKATTASVSASIGTIATSTASLTSNSAATGTINANATVDITETEANAKKEFTISGVTAASTITLTTSGSNKRLIAWDAYYVTQESTYTVKYDANEGSGAPEDQTGLSSLDSVDLAATTGLSRFGFDCDGWATSASGAKAFSGGATGVDLSDYEGENKTVTLYAHWNAKNYTGLTYTGAPSTTVYDAGDTFDPTGITAIYAQFDGVSDTDNDVKSDVSWNTLAVGTTASGTYTIGEVTQTVTVTGIIVNKVTSKTDTLTRETTGVASSSNYTSWSGKTVSSAAVYAGQSAGDNDTIQLRSNNSNSGIVTTASGGTINKVTVEWYSGTSNDRTLNVYGKTTAYSSASDLYGNSSGTLLGTINRGTSTELEITGKYDYVGVRSASGALYMNSISFKWDLPSTDPEVRVTSDDSTKTISKMKSETDDNVRVTLSNIEDETDWSFTFDEGGQEGLSSSSYVSVVQAATADEHVYKLNISLTAVGSTVIHINVDGTDCSSTISVTVTLRPATLKIYNGSTEVTGSTMEIMTGGSAKNISFKYVDTESPAGTHDIGNNLITSVSSEPTKLRLSGGNTYLVLNPDAAGENITVTCTITSTSEWNTPVTASFTVNVVDDYLESVHQGGVTFNTGLTADQGDSPTLAVFATRVGDTHFGSTANIPLDMFRFSYDDELGVTADQFGYDFSHGTDVDDTHKSQTIFVYCTLGNVSVGSYTVTVEQGNDPLTEISLTNVSGKAASITRVDTLQLEWSYTAESGGHNPTDGKGVLFTVSNASTGSEISVSSTGLISAGNVPGATARVTITSDHAPSISDYVDITISMDSMTYQVSETATWNLVTDASDLAVNDQIIITNADSSYGLKAYSSGNNCAATSITVSGSKITVLGDAAPLTLSDAGDGKFYLNDGTNYLYAAGSDKNYLKGKSSTDASNGKWLFEYSTDHMSIVASGSSNRNVMQYNPNNGNPIFSCYASASQTNLQVYKLAGGNTPHTVDATLFNGVYNNFGGEGKTYQWSESCADFNASAWQSACNALKGITNYSSYKLNRAIGNIAGNEIEVFLAKYDIIIGKLGTAYDHLGRFSEGGINASGRISSNPLQFNAKNTTSVIIIVVITSVSVAAVGGYFFFRKKKEN